MKHEKIIKEEVYGFPISCSDSCPHKSKCFYGEGGHCGGLSDSYNYGCQRFYVKGEPQRFTRKPPPRQPTKKEQ